MGFFEALFVEAFCSLHMSFFVLLPIAKLKYPQESKKYFWKYFWLRAIILLIGNFINTNICMVDFFMVFIGAFIILPITTVKYKENLSQLNVASKSTTTTVSGETTSEDNILNENLELPTDIPDLTSICEFFEKEEENGSNNPIFYKTHSTSEELLDEYVSSLIKNKEDINEENINQIKNARIIFSLITFLNISYICVFHRNFMVCFVIQIIAILIYRNSIKKMNIFNYIKKQIKSRPNDNMDYIIASAKQHIAHKNELSSRFILPVTLTICFMLFSTPHMIFGRKDDGYAVRYYTLAIFNKSNVVIPDEHNGKKVIEVRGDTFANLKTLKTISLPKYITEIRGNTFENSGLREIVIPEGVTRIGGRAFFNCNRLKNVELPSTLKEIGSSAFRSCDSLYNIKIPKRTSVNEKAFKESPTYVERY